MINILHSLLQTVLYFQVYKFSVDIHLDDGPIDEGPSSDLTLIVTMDCLIVDELIVIKMNLDVCHVYTYNKQKHNTCTNEVNLNRLTSSLQLVDNTLGSNHFNR